MTIGELKLESRSKKILTYLIIEYWLTDNNISYYWQDRTEEQEKQFYAFLEDGKSGTLDLTPLANHQETLFKDLRKARNCGIKSFNEISKELKEKMGLIEIIDENDFKVKKIREIIKYACYDGTNEETIRKIKEVLGNE